MGARLIREPLVNHHGCRRSARFELTVAKALYSSGAHTRGTMCGKSQVRMKMQLFYYFGDQILCCFYNIFVLSPVSGSFVFKKLCFLATKKTLIFHN